MTNLRRGLRKSTAEKRNYQKRSPHPNLFPVPDPALNLRANPTMFQEQESQPRHRHLSIHLSRWTRRPRCLQHCRPWSPVVKKKHLHPRVIVTWLRSWQKICSEQRHRARRRSRPWPPPRQCEVLTPRASPQRSPSRAAVQGSPRASPQRDKWTVRDSSIEQMCTENIIPTNPPVNIVVPDNINNVNNIAPTTTGGGQSTNIDANARQSNVPPIVVEKFVSPFKEGIRFLPHSENEFRLIQKYLIEYNTTDKSLHWYCYTLESERPTKVIIRGLPKSTPTEDLKGALIDEGCNVLSLRMIPSLRGRPGCVYHITLAQLSETELKRLYAMKMILCIPNISVEGWKGPGRCAAMPPLSGLLPLLPKLPPPSTLREMRRGASRPRLPPPTRRPPNLRQLREGPSSEQQALPCVRASGTSTEYCHSAAGTAAAGRPAHQTTDANES